MPTDSPDPELAAEQSVVDHAYACLERRRAAAMAVRANTDDAPGGTFANRYERDVIVDGVDRRLSQLELGDQSLVFGRIDLEARETGVPGERYHIGRMAVADEVDDPVVVDWRAPVAETFYRATGRDPMGLVRRRHIASRGRTVVGLDDEFFGEAVDGVADGRIVGRGALIAALEASRSGRLNDIVATIQAEQDEVIRSPMPGVLVVQGGPGTGKTVVALHRAAYLLYTHRFPLEGQGVLVIGPNRLFLSYIEQVLPSLGEAGVDIAVLADLVPHIRASQPDPAPAARLKGELRICKLLAKAVRDRQRVPRDGIVIPYGLERLRISAEEAGQLVAAGRRRGRGHNAGRRPLEQAFFDLLAAKSRTPIDSSELRGRIRHTDEVREALERMWPIMSPASFLNDLLGSRALLRSAGRRWYSDAELGLLARPRAEDPAKVIWSTHDVPLLDEALELLGPRPRHRDDDVISTFGHIVVDEAQDLSPMELRMIDRRSLGGSITLVGDIAQATSAAAHDDWSSVLEHLPARHAPRLAELTLGYRLPGPAMELASRVLPLAAPGLTPPSSVREVGDVPVVTATDATRFAADLLAAVRREVGEVGSGNVAVIAPDSYLARVQQALDEAGIDFGRALRGSLDHQVTVAPVRLVKGLELDACVVVDPASILDEELRGPQALYVALTRATKRLTILHERPLPAVLADPAPEIPDPTPQIPDFTHEI